MICVTRLSDCSTSVGIVRADEATGIWAKVLVAEATSAVSKATRANKRGKLADIKIVVLLACVAGWLLNDLGYYKDSQKTEPNQFGGYHTVFQGVNQTPDWKHT